MILTNTDFIPEQEVTEILGLVRGNTIQAKGMGKDIVAVFRNMVGGEIKEYTGMLSEAREIALRLRAAINEIECPKIGLQTASFGLAALTDNDTLNTLVGRADQALFRAKKLGKDRVEITS